MTKRRISRHRLQNLFSPTAGLYRYVAVIVLGLAVLLLGIGVSFKAALVPMFRALALWWNSQVGGLAPADTVEVTSHLLGGLLLVLGFYGVYWGVRTLVQRFVETVDPNAKTGVVDVYVRRQQLARGPRIVALGGGTGLSTLLRGLKQYSSNITAIVTVTDDGGSSGRLVQELGMLPPGDIRNCLVALADAEKRMTDLFQHRFQSQGSSLSGHSLGNLLIAGFVDQAGGDVDRALQMASEVLAIRGRVIPSTTTSVQLRALMEDGEEICGETAIVASGLRVRRLYLHPDQPAPHPEALTAIQNADLVCIGPGSVYTSVIPNLLVPGIAEAIHDAECVKAYICNVMTQRGESESFTAAEHLVAIQANVEKRVCDYVLVNSGIPSQEIIERYREYGQELVEADVDRVRAMGYKAVTGDLMSESDTVRHDPARLAARLMDLIYR